MFAHRKQQAHRKLEQVQCMYIMTECNNENKVYSTIVVDEKLSHRMEAVSLFGNNTQRFTCYNIKKSQSCCFFCAIFLKQQEKRTCKS